MRYSSRREAILKILRDTKSHPNAEWVYAKVREQIPNVSLGTVYRNLKELSDAGELNTLETECGSLHFDADTSPHAHFVCNGCGAISDVFGYSEDTAALEKSGYRIDGVKTVIYGLCPRCVKENKAHTRLS